MMNRDPSQRGGESLLLSAREVARLLRVSERHLYTLQARGELPAPVRLGRCVRWPTRELQEWIEAGSPRRADWERIRCNERRR